MAEGCVATYDTVHVCTQPAGHDGIHQCGNCYGQWLDGRIVKKFQDSCRNDYERDRRGHAWLARFGYLAEDIEVEMGHVDLAIADEYNGPLIRIQAEYELASPKDAREVAAALSRIADGLEQEMERNGHFDGLGDS